MDTINKRIAFLLQDMNITKTAFAKTLKVSQQYISKLISKGTPSDRLIEDICTKFHVNENWLRTGEGNMYVIVDDKLSAYVSEITDSDDEFIKSLILYYMELRPEEKEIIKAFFKGIIGNIEDKKSDKSL